MFLKSLAAAALLFPSLSTASEYTTIACPDTESTYPASINSGQEIVGSCGHKGFIRFRNGVYMTFTAPYAEFMTYAADINDSGEIIGSYQKTGADHNHGYVRSADGVFTEFDPPGSGEHRSREHQLRRGRHRKLRSRRRYCRDFVRDTQGNITTVSVPGSLSTQPTGINSSGEITGFEQDAHWNPRFPARRRGQHSPLSTCRGAILNRRMATRAEPSADAINSSGQVAGWWTDSSNVRHGFTRDASGSFVTFDAPGASSLWDHLPPPSTTRAR
jgi:hypothetical protein